MPNQQIRYVYAIENGTRILDEVGGIGGFGGMVLETGQAIMVNDVERWNVDNPGFASVITSGAPAQSVVFVPLTAGDKVFGRISLQNVDRVDAFTESDLRLLTTIASSLSVALENARLLVETKQRAAELAIINSVQEGLASQLDMQQMYELVGDKIHEIFDAQAADIGLYDLTTTTIHYPYAIEKGVRYADTPGPIIGYGAMRARFARAIACERCRGL